MPRPRKYGDDELVAAAARTIARLGPQELTLADVARDAGVAPATLVQRFGSKRGLLLAVAASAPTTVAEAFAAARTRNPTALGALEDALMRLAASISDPDEVANHLAFLAIDLADPEFRGHTARDVAAFRVELTALLHEAAGRGEIELRGRPAAAEVLQAAYHGTLLMWAIERRGDAALRVRDHVRLVLRPYRRK